MTIGRWIVCTCPFNESVGDPRIATPIKVVEVQSELGFERFEKMLNQEEKNGLDLNRIYTPMALGIHIGLLKEGIK